MCGCHCVSQLTELFVYWVLAHLPLAFGLWSRRPSPSPRQGAHALEKSGKTGNFVKKNSLQGKIREFGKWVKSGNFTKTKLNMSGKYQGIFSSIIYI